MKLITDDGVEFEIEGMRSALVLENEMRGFIADLFLKFKDKTEKKEFSKAMQIEAEKGRLDMIGID